MSASNGVSPNGHAGRDVSGGVAEQTLGIGEPATFVGNERTNRPVNEAARAMRGGACGECGRPLSDPNSLARGLGPVCARKLSVGDESDGGQALQMPCSEPYSPDYVSIWREPDGTLHASVPRCVIHHSPSGFECGYSGSGPADLALNIMAAFFPLASVPCNGPAIIPRASSHQYGGPVRCWRGECSRLAWDLHQAFKREFIAVMPREGGQIESRVIRAWAVTRLNISLSAPAHATDGVPGPS